MVNQSFIFQYIEFSLCFLLGNNDNSVVTGCGTNSNTSTLSSPTLPIYYEGHSPPLSNSITPHCMYYVMLRTQIEKFLFFVFISNESIA